MSAERYHWEIEYIPDDPDRNQCENIFLIGTREEADQACNMRHPDYLCREIVFHRSAV
jgi:hypothetical protein